MRKCIITQYWRSINSIKNKIDVEIRGYLSKYGVIDCLFNYNNSIINTIKLNHCDAIQLDIIGDLSIELSDLDVETQISLLEYLMKRFP
jgi:hypothetical protein